MENTLFAAKVYDDTTKIKIYSEKLLSLVKKQFITRKINQYDYENFINILTCLCLQTDEIREALDDFMKLETIRELKRIDLKV